MLLLLTLGCSTDSSEIEEAPFETEDVGAGVDHQIRPETDTKPAPREMVSLIGLLPSDFPADVWVYEPSSIVDLPAPDSSELFVTLKARAEFAAVAAKLGAKLAASGWSGASLESGDTVVFRKGERQIVVGLEDQRGETRIRVEY